MFPSSLLSAATLCLVAFPCRASNATQDADGSIRVQVVNGVNQQPAAGARVSWVGQEEALSLWRSTPLPVQASDWHEFHRRLGREGVTDAQGWVTLAVDAKVTHLQASLGEMFGVQVVPEGQETVHLELEPDRSAAVRVVDGQGSPRQGVDVGARMVFDVGGRDTSSMPSMFRWWDRTDEHGIARIEHVQLAGETPLEFVFGFPESQGAGARFEPLAPPSDPLELVLPDTGRITIELPSEEDAWARLRLASDRFRGNRRPGVHLAEEGEVVFEHVGLGLDLDVEAGWKGLDTPQTMRIPALVAPAQEVSVSFRSKSLSSISGRLLDWRGEPVRSTELTASLNIIGAGTSSSRGSRLRTDADGHFTLGLPSRRDERGESLLHLVLCDRDRSARSNPCEGAESVYLTLDEYIEQGTSEVGDVHLALPAWRRLRMAPPISDEELEQLFWRVVANDGMYREGSIFASYDACLTEMARRGGERWVQFLEHAIELHGQGGERGSSAFRYLGDLELWTALRRAQDRPDPMLLELHTATPIETAFPTLPTIELALVLADAEEARPTVTRGGDYRSGRFVRCRVEARQGDRLAPLRRWNVGMGGGMSSSRALEPGERIGLQVALGDFIALDAPGDHEVRVHYHDSDGIADTPDVEGRVLTSTEPFVMRWTPLRLSRADVDAATVRVSIALESIDENEPVVITTRPFTPPRIYSRAKPVGEEKILAEGWSALPRLLAALDEDLTPRRRAWVFGLLYDLTGVLDPREAQVLGRYVEVAGFFDSEHDFPGSGGFDREAGGPIDASAQQEWVARWSRMKELVRVE